MSPYIQGIEAYNEGLDFSANPYKDNNWTDWAHGWDAAREIDEVIREIFQEKVDSFDPVI